MENILSILLGHLIAWIILMYVPVRKTVSYFTLNPWPIESDDSNLAIIGVGLAAPKPKPSVMDATPASVATPVMVPPRSPMPVPVMAPPRSPVPVPVMVPPRSPVPVPVMAPSSKAVAAQPISITQGAAPSA